MNTSRTFLLAKQTFKATIKQRSFFILWLIFLILLIYAGTTGHHQTKAQNEMMHTYQDYARKSWLDNPDKHPHRMAHFGSFAFRIRHPLSFFDFGMENYAGSIVFLEAHKQNSVNFSEASFSTGLLRLGEMSIAMLLQTLLPLIIFFLGFNSIAADRENGTLKILVSQGAGVRTILFGRAVGLWILSSLFFIPAFLITVTLLLTHNAIDGSQPLSRLSLIFLSYTIFYWIIAMVAVSVSASSMTARSALVKLLGIWIVFAMVLPRLVQVVSNEMYPSPTKLSFESAIEEDILKQGDSHNPDDAFFRSLRDSVLAKYNVDSVHKLPFNYGGLVGKASERLSSETYVRHQDRLTQLHRRQNNVAKSMSWINPFMMIKSSSMSLAGSDFEAYVNFQQQAEAYRYELAQKMNDLQMEFVSNIRPSGGTHSLHIDKEHWSGLKDFDYKYLSLKDIFKMEMSSVAAMIFWLVLSFILLMSVSKQIKIIG
ncbi:DUF3526 domain-containing protein [Ferruginibacter sp.]